VGEVRDRLAALVAHGDVSAGSNPSQTLLQDAVRGAMPSHGGGHDSITSPLLNHKAQTQKTGERLSSSLHLWINSLYAFSPRPAPAAP